MQQRNNNIIPQHFISQISPFRIQHKFYIIQKQQKQKHKNYTTDAR